MYKRQAVRGAAVEGCESPAERLPSTFCVGVGWTPGTWPSEAHSAAPTHKTNAAHTASAGLQLMPRLRGWRISAARSFAFASRVDVAVNPPSCRFATSGSCSRRFKMCIRDRIKTPIMLNRGLWERSGHWDHYKENMYTTKIDDTDFAIKPMNCPGGILVYQRRLWSYRDLPIRSGELGLVHRHEKSGALHGLMRVRCLSLIHISCRSGRHSW